MTLEQETELDNFQPELFNDLKYAVVVVRAKRC